MNASEHEDVGFIKYSGDAVSHGVIDAGTAGLALIGLNEAIRFFNEKQAPSFAKLDYEIPVKTEPGSWTAYVLAAIGTGAGVFALSYAKKAGEKMAEKDFEDIGFRDIFRKSLSAIQFLIQLVKHTGRNKGWDTNGMVVRENGTEIGIRNKHGEIIFLPVEFFRWYGSLPSQLLFKMTSVITTERIFSIGVKNGGSYKEVTVEAAERGLFTYEPVYDDELFLFPELEHGQPVRLEGKLIRGNEASNSVGLEYEGHVLNCLPERGNVRQFKPALFLKCVVEGTVSRLTKQRLVAEKRPTIILSKVTPLEQDDDSDLFAHH